MGRAREVPRILGGPCSCEIRTTRGCTHWPLVLGCEQCNRVVSLVSKYQYIHHRILETCECEAQYISLTGVSRRENRWTIQYGHCKRQSSSFDPLYGHRDPPGNRLPPEPRATGDYIPVCILNQLRYPGNMERLHLAIFYQSSPTSTNRPRTCPPYHSYQDPLISFL